MNNSIVFSVFATAFALILGFVVMSWIATKRAQKKSLISLGDINEAIGESLYVVDSSGLITEINSSALSFFGVTKQAVLGKRAHDLLHERRHEPGKDENECDLEHLGTSGFSGELQFLNHEQQPTWVRVNSRSLFDGHRNLGSVVAFHDISLERGCAENLHEAATAFETPEDILVTDTKGLILQVNSAFSKLTGYSGDEVIGLTADALLNSSKQDEASHAQMWSTLKAEQSWQGKVWNRRKDSPTYLERLTMDPVKDKSGEVSQDEADQLAFYDSLTQLPNRRLLKERLNHILPMSERHQEFGGVIFIDFDCFKALNDSKGHSAGDELLVEVAKGLLASVRETDTVARIDGDEFAVLLTDLGSKEKDAVSAVQVVVNNILDSFAKGVELSSGVFHTNLNMGVEVFLGKTLSDDEILKHADMAMYRAKKAGRNRVCFFNPKMQEQVEQALAFEKDMAFTIGTGFTQLELYYQAQVDQNAKVQSAEALIRWHHPQKGMVAPLKFIPMIERSGQIIPVGEWVLRTACDQLLKWQANPKFAHLTVAVNVSAKQLLNTGFVTRLQEIVEGSGIYPGGLKIELTESSIVTDLDKAIAVMTEIRRLGIGLSMDHFGTGSSTLTYLKRLPLTQLKIDQSFVYDLERDMDRLAIVRTIIAMAKILKLIVVAEGVETLHQKELLELDGCHLFQGYYYSRPLPVEEFEKLLDQSSELSKRVRVAVKKLLTR